MKAARRMISDRLEKKKNEIEFPKWCEEKMGVFVTLTINGGLRGCIGFCEPLFPLREALEQAALSAAFEDPRFPPLTKWELDKIIVEVSVLTEPKEIEVASPSEYPDKVKIGEDGLIVRYGRVSGLLLPQVPVELGWGPNEFLCHTCLKAGLRPERWKDGVVKIYEFHAEVFSEEEPGGKIVKNKSKAEH